MKQILVLLLSISLFIGAFAQAPDGIQYQSIIRDANGDVMSNTELSIQISILYGVPDGEVVYREIHDVYTNTFGLVTLIIGSASPQFGSFQEIDWGRGDHFFELAVNLEGDDQFTILGVTQFLSVPYAFQAQQAQESQLAKALTLVDDNGKEYQIRVDTLGNIAAHALSENRIVITFASVPTSVEVSTCPLRYDKQHALTFEQDDNLAGVYKSLLMLLTGGVPEFEPDYQSPGRFVNDGFGGQLTMKANTTSWVMFGPGQDNYWDWAQAGAGTYADYVINYDRVQEMFDKGFGLVSHEYWRISEGLSDAQLFESAQLYADFLEDYYGQGMRPLGQVMGGGHEFNLTAWNQGWFDQGALYGVNGSGCAPSKINIDVDVSEFTTTQIVGRTRVEGYSNDQFEELLNDLVGTSGHYWKRIYGHNITDSGTFVNYWALKHMFDYLEENYADELWVPSVQEIVRYFHVRDKVVLHQDLHGNVLTITLDDSSLPDYIIPRALSLKVHADQLIQNISVSGFESKYKGETSTEGLIDIEW